MTTLRDTVLSRLSRSDPAPVHCEELMKLLDAAGELPEDELEADIYFVMLMGAIEDNFEVEGIVKQGDLFYLLTDLGREQVRQSQLRQFAGQKEQKVC